MQTYPRLPICKLLDFLSFHLMTLPFLVDRITVMSDKMKKTDQKITHARFGILLSKIVLVIEKNFWNSRLNLQNFWDHQNNLFEQWKVRPPWFWQSRRRRIATCPPWFSDHAPSLYTTLVWNRSSVLVSGTETNVPFRYQFRSQFCFSETIFFFKLFSFFPTSLWNISFYKVQNKPRS